MRLSQEPIQYLKRQVAEEPESTAHLCSLGARLDEDTRDGEVDLLVAPTALITGSNSRDL